MKFIQEFFEGCRVSGIYLCKHKQAAVTKNGKPYENVILQDKTGQSMPRSGIRIRWGLMILKHWIILKSWEMSPILQVHCS